MLKDKDGNKLFRKVEIKIVYPDAIFPPKILSKHAGPRQGFNPNGVDDILMQVADQLDTLYPWWEFRPVPLAPTGRTIRYVFTFAGYRSTPPVEATISEFTQQPQESKALEPEAAEDNTSAAIKEAVGNTLQELSSQV